MRVLLVHNAYAKYSGEEALINNCHRLLEAKGHEVRTFFRSSEELSEMTFGKVRAFFTGMHSPSSRNAIRHLLGEFRPDVAHIQNVFPFISPSVLGECRRAGVPVLMRVQNYRLVCPNGLHLVNGQICERCNGGKEYWCVLRNCEGSLFKSLGYALRNYTARRCRFFLDNVTIYACVTEFQKGRLIAEGFPADRIVVIPNTAKNGHPGTISALGDYVGYVGRVSPEKGVATLLSAAGNSRNIPFKIAGAYGRMPQLYAQAPGNCEFLGHFGPEKLSAFYNSARIIVVCSICFEGFPTVLVEAMLHGKPVVCSRIGGLPEIVDDEVTGLLFEPGNAEELARKIRYLWDRPDLCRKMGQAGRSKALNEYLQEKYYEGLMAAYEQAVELGPGGPCN